MLWRCEDVRMWRCEDVKALDASIFAYTQTLRRPDGVYTHTDAFTRGRKNTHPTPHDVHAQQAAKPAGQEDIQTKCSHLGFPERRLRTASYRSCVPAKPPRQQSLSHLRMAQSPKRAHFLACGFDSLLCKLWSGCCAMWRCENCTLTFCWQAAVVAV